MSNDVAQADTNAPARSATADSNAPPDTNALRGANLRPVKFPAPPAGRAGDAPDHPLGSGVGVNKGM
jgi:hypothetical protein